ncbi:acyltransferase family protein [Spirulina subsalsa]|uniref:acyltransferase family protein n=1 Tax=Spirulina subsalsa TaxID=54311 RepID=UPI00052549CE|nr:heparan-alpha-glucosaminide N-acetyltransferase domain-containing protein [Spirulina subsalsa]
MGQRLTSLDVLRGMAIAGMILANNPGSWSFVYPPLLHAEWHGFTPTDWVFPAFLFISGTAMAFSFAKYQNPPSEIPPFQRGARGDNSPQSPTSSVYWQLGRRCLVLFLLGLFLNGLSIFLTGFPNFDFSQIRILGVLQRISLAYWVGAIAVLNLKRRGLWIFSALVLLGYWAIMTLIPVPGFGAGDLSPEGNVAAYIDRLILTTDHLYLQGQFDPEGLLSTFPAVITLILGYLTGDWLRQQKPPEDPPQILSTASLGLVQFGLMGIVSGALWGVLFPINKQLWTSSYVLYSAGWTLLIFALCYELIEVRNIRRWSFPFQVMGLNALFVFVASGVIVRILHRTKIGTGDDAVSTYAWLYKNLFEPWAGSWNGSLFFAIANLLIWGLILYLMYRQRWFIKL